ncbi:MAG: tRNA lysidine(34) synthetase TilS C-terminal domain-containing protein [Isosphaeraceae bacterium]
MVWEEAGWPEGRMGADHWNYLADLAGRPKGRLMVADGVMAQAGAVSFRLQRPAPAERPPAPADLLVPGEVAWGPWIVRAFEESEPRPASKLDELIDLGALDLDPKSPALTVRAPRPDDRFDPLGLGGRVLSLKHFLRARGLHRADRARVALVCDRSGIAWVVGHRIAQRVRRTKETRAMLGLSAVAVDPSPGAP